MEKRGSSPSFSFPEVTASGSHPVAQTLQVAEIPHGSAAGGAESRQVGAYAPASVASGAAPCLDGSGKDGRRGHPAPRLHCEAVVSQGQRFRHPELSGRHLHGEVATLLQRELHLVRGSAG